MAQVRGDVDVGVGGTDGVEQPVPRAAAHGHPAHLGVQVAGHADAARGGGHDGGHPFGEAAEAHGGFELPHASDTRVAVAADGRGERAHARHAQAPGDGIGDASDR